MDFDEIAKILDMMREHDLAEFELEREDFKLRLRKQTAGQAAPAAMPAYHHAPPVHATPSAEEPPGSSLESSGVADEEDLEFAIIKSPIVGTFYRASEPGARPFADVGEFVRKGQVLCIIEAMKLMNEINAELDGEIVKVYVENGQAVQYGERLFAVKPAAEGQ
jgi:acetyl-CoA carboxylase biotin carboxyl carrier protein